MRARAPSARRPRRSSGCSRPAPAPRTSVRPRRRWTRPTAEIAAHRRRDRKAAETDLDRFEALLSANAGSQKQRDDAKARVDVARERAARRARSACASRARRVDRVAPARAARSSTPPARASPRWTRRSPCSRRACATRRSSAPSAGIVTQKLVDAGELVAPRAPLVVVTDLDHAWANVFVPEPVVPRLALGQAGDGPHRCRRRGVPGKVTFISPRAEFTPRNVQTADERSKLVYRVKVTRGQPRRRAQAGHAGGRGRCALHADAADARRGFDGASRSGYGATTALGRPDARRRAAARCSA